MKAVKSGHNPPKAKATKAGNHDAHDRSVGLACDLMVCVPEVRFPHVVRKARVAMYTTEKHLLIGQLVRHAMHALPDVVRHALERITADEELHERERLAEIQAAERDRPKPFIEVSIRMDDEPQCGGRGVAKRTAAKRAIVAPKA